MDKGDTASGPEMEFEVPSWNQIYEMLLALANKIRKDRSPINLIVGISRGGWIPARVIADLIEKPRLVSIGVEFYSGIAETKSNPVITQSPSVSGRDKHILIVDDVADSGESLKLVVSYLKEQGAKSIKTATIYYKPWSEITPDYYEKETKKWIIFPWEKKEAVRSLIKKSIKEKKSIEDVKAKLIEIGLGPDLSERFIQEITEDE